MIFLDVIFPEFQFGLFRIIIQFNIFIRVFILPYFVADGKFNFIIRVRGYGYGLYLDIDVFEASMGTRELKHNLGDITFLTLDGDIIKIEDLKFTFA